MIQQRAFPAFCYLYSLFVSSCACHYSSYFRFIIIILSSCSWGVVASLRQKQPIYEVSLWLESTLRCYDHISQAFSLRGEGINPRDTFFLGNLPPKSVHLICSIRAFTNRTHALSPALEHKLHKICTPATCPAPCRRPGGGFA